MKRMCEISILICTICIFGSFSETYGNTIELLPYADGTYYRRQYQECDCCGGGGCYTTGIYEGINAGLYAKDCCAIGYGSPCEACWNNCFVNSGIIEFDISSLAGVFQSNAIGATLILTVNQEQPDNRTVYLHTMDDLNEDGVISVNDHVFSGAALGSIDGPFGVGATLTFDVTDSAKHDLFDSNQTAFSGFVITQYHTTAGPGYGVITCGGGTYFYDHTTPEYAPRLMVTETTVIELSSFTVTPSDRKVILKWTTASEIDNAGFNLYRAEAENGTYVKLNSSLIPAEGTSTSGASYQFIDEGVKNRTTYFYKLEDIDLKGVSTLHGPVSVTPRVFHNVR